MNKMVRKLKKSNKVLRFLYYLVMISYVVGLVLFTKSLLSLTYSSSPFLHKLYNLFISKSILVVK